MGKPLNICVTCLSIDRRLIPVHTLTTLLQEIRFEELKHSNGGVCWECCSNLVKFFKFKRRAKLAQDIISDGTEHAKTKSLSTLSKTKVIISDYDFNCETNVKIDYNSVKEENPDPSDGDIDNNGENIDEFDNTIESIDQIGETSDINENPETKPEKNENTYSKIDIIENKYNTNPLIKQENKIQYKNLIFVETQNHTEHKDVETIDTKPHQKFPRKTLYRQKKDVIKTPQIIQDTDKEFEEKFVQYILTEEEMERSREERRNHPSFKTLPFICHGCLLGFRKEVKYQSHLKKKHDERIGNFSCNICTMRFPHNLALNKHKRKHYVVYRCKLCRYRGNDLRSAVNHCKTKHAEDKLGSIHCGQCNFVAKNSEGLEEHMKTEHQFWCDECGEKFTIKRNIMIHLARVHNSIRAFKCEFCKKRFNTKMQLDSHMARHNDSLAKKLSYCEECDVQYKTIVIYREHLKNNANHSEGYPCPECDKKFKGKTTLKQHYDYHHLHKSQYKCEECNKTFISKSALNKHKSGHLGQDRPRKFSCNVCTKKFYTSQMLQNHKFIHTDERLFMCEDCGDTFKQKATLYTHTRLKHKGWRRRKRES